MGEMNRECSFEPGSGPCHHKGCHEVEIIPSTKPTGLQFKDTPYRIVTTGNGRYELRGPGGQYHASGSLLAVQAAANLIAGKDGWTHS
jgi:hypothetical protein